MISLSELCGHNGRSPNQWGKLSMRSWLKKLLLFEVSFTWVIFASGVACLLAIVFYLWSTKMQKHPIEPYSYVSNIDLEHGRNAIRKYGCGSCHVIPGVREANGRVGPSLKDIHEQMFIAGALPNDTENMIRWIRYPQTVDPNTAMPDLGVTEEEARQITGYLFEAKH